MVSKRALRESSAGACLREGWPGGVLVLVVNYEFALVHEARERRVTGVVWGGERCVGDRYRLISLNNQTNQLLLS